MNRTDAQEMGIVVPLQSGLPMCNDDHTTVMINMGYSAADFRMELRVSCKQHYMRCQCCFTLDHLFLSESWSLTD